MRNFLTIIFLFIIIVFPACSNKGLTDANVESAVEAILQKVRLGGSISVKGIQELPQQNAAIADLTFNQFEYAVTYQGQLIEANNYHPPASNTSNGLPSMEQMFPARKTSYSGQGTATLKKYNDGRWILEKVEWGPPLSGFVLVGNLELGASSNRKSSGSLDPFDIPNIAYFYLVFSICSIAALVIYLIKGESRRPTDSLRQSSHKTAEDRLGQESDPKPNQ